MRIPATFVASIAAITLGFTALPAGARQGQVVRATDGDTVVIDGDARVRFVRRLPALVRTIFLPGQRALIVLADYPDAKGVTEGRADTSMHYIEIAGDWPLEQRWEGQATIEEYGMAGGAREGVGIRFPQGLVQLLSRLDKNSFRDPSALAVLTHTGSGSRGPGQRVSFDEAEQRELVDTGARARGQTSQASGVTSSVTLSAGAAAGGVMTQPGSQPVRVGGNIRTPQKIHHVDPVLPEQARQAGAFGVVVVEATIGVDGTVTQARVLRSIPLLDEAALAAVRQWRYEPTLLNGQPVPVIMTVTVAF